MLPDRRSQLRLQTFPRRRQRRLLPAGVLLLRRARAVAALAHRRAADDVQELTVRLNHHGWLVARRFGGRELYALLDGPEAATARLSSNVNLPEGQGMGTPMDGDETVDGDIESFKTVELPKAGRSAGKVKPTNGDGTTL